MADSLAINLRETRALLREILGSPPGAYPESVRVCAQTTNGWMDIRDEGIRTLWSEPNMRAIFRRYTRAQKGRYSRSTPESRRVTAELTREYGRDAMNKFYGARRATGHMHDIRMCAFQLRMLIRLMTASDRMLELMEKTSVDTLTPEEREEAVRDHLWMRHLDSRYVPSVLLWRLRQKGA